MTAAKNSVTKSALLSSVPGLSHGFTTKLLPKEEFERLSAATASAKQVHKNGIVWTERFQKAAVEADGIGTASPGLPVGVFTADCSPILLAALGDKDKALAVMAVHAGWRGTALNIADKALRFFHGKTPSARRFVCAIGPSISKAGFEVGQEVVDAFPGALERGIAVFLRKEMTADGEKNKFLFDLPGENVRQLKLAASALGISLACEQLPDCTVQDGELYPSYRRDREKAGRMLSFLSFR